MKKILLPVFLSLAFALCADAAEQKKAAPDSFLYIRVIHKKELLECMIAHIPGNEAMLGWTAKPLKSKKKGAPLMQVKIKESEALDIIKTMSRKEYAEYKKESFPKDADESGDFIIAIMDNKGNATNLWQIPQSLNTANFERWKKMVRWLKLMESM